MKPLYASYSTAKRALVKEGFKMDSSHKSNKGIHLEQWKNMNKTAFVTVLHNRSPDHRRRPTTIEVTERSLLNA